MKDTRLIVNLTHTWVHKKFHDNFIALWMARPRKWNRIVLQKVYAIKAISNCTSLYDKVKYPQGNLHNGMMASFDSCLHYKGLIREAESMMQCAGEFYHTSQTYWFFSQYSVKNMQRLHISPFQGIELQAR